MPCRAGSSTTNLASHAHALKLTQSQMLGFILCHPAPLHRGASPSFAPVPRCYCRCWTVKAPAALPHLCSPSSHSNTLSQPYLTPSSYPHTHTHNPIPCCATHMHQLRELLGHSSLRF